MKMLLVAIFALSCAQISNAACPTITKWCAPEDTINESATTSTTTTSTTTTSTTITKWPTTKSTTTTTITTTTITTMTTTTTTTTTSTTRTESPITVPPTTEPTTTEPTTLTPPTYPPGGTKYGTPAAKNQFPYVAFLKSTNAHKIQYCSGSLIHPRWVLTSAYCMLPDSTVEVTLGALVPFDEDDPDRVVVQSEEVFVHPGYLPIHLNPKNDVALIKLSKPVASAAIIPIDLKWDSGLIPKNNITFAGWGEVGYETLTYTRNITLVKGPCRCLDVKGQTVVYEDAAMNLEHFCGLSTKFFCFIHNGGGLVVDGVLVAVLSSRCFSHCRHREGIFTNIYNHLQWIDDNSNGELGPKVLRACSDPSIKTPGVYLIRPNKDMEPFEVYCDIVEGKKWTVIQQRFNKEVDFYRNYANYTKGFGPLAGNHWLGLEKIHQLTKKSDHELLVEMQAYNLTKAYARYSSFQVASEETGFLLAISGYSGNAGDSMYQTGNGYDNLNGMKFSAFDNDQDKWPAGHCAERWQGAWWHNYCSFSNLNGPYHDAAVLNDYKTMRWTRNFGNFALKSARMIIRRK